MENNDIIINNENKSGKNNITKVILIVLAVIGGFLVGFFVIGSVFEGSDPVEKTLVCTQKTTESGMDMEMEATIKFKNDDAKEIDAVMTVDLGQYAAYKDTFIDTFKKEYQEYIDKGVDVEFSSEGTKIIIEIEAEKENMKDVNMFSKEKYEDVKKELEASKFICK